MSYEHVDVLIVGAGISGIGAGYRIQSNCPDKSFAILEGA
jgi:monooxygenase